MRRTAPARATVSDSDKAGKSTCAVVEVSSFSVEATSPSVRDGSRQPQSMPGGLVDDAGDRKTALTLECPHCLGGLMVEQTTRGAGADAVSQQRILDVLDGVTDCTNRDRHDLYPLRFGD
jgi:hypothetical protein